MTALIRKQLRAGRRTWIELDRGAIRRNIGLFRGLLAPRTKLLAVVKSNAYGHGLALFSRIAHRAGVDGFCVDSLVEGLRLRREGIRKPIIVLGSTMAPMLPLAARANIAVSISNFEALRALASLRRPPAFHIKIDTGMRRQGFFPRDILRVIRTLKATPGAGKKFEGIFTHFAAAKDPLYPSAAEAQVAEFLGVAEKFSAAGWTRLMRHAAATGGALMNEKYHLDAVRIGIGLYGYWPSEELEAARGGELHLSPALAWRSVISETKRLAVGDFVGYDRTERIRRPTIAAVVPVGYWHGVFRSLSGRGEVLVRGRRARILGRVSMDMIVIDVTGTGARSGDLVTLIGRDGQESVFASELGVLSGTSHYEYLTRLNPLIERASHGT